MQTQSASGADAERDSRHGRERLSAREAAKQAESNEAEQEQQAEQAQFEAEKVEQEENNRQRSCHAMQFRNTAGRAGRRADDGGRRPEREEGGEAEATESQLHRGDATCRPPGRGRGRRDRPRKVACVSSVGERPRPERPTAEGGTLPCGRQCAGRGAQRAPGRGGGRRLAMGKDGGSRGPAVDEDAVEEAVVLPRTRVAEAVVLQWTRVAGAVVPPPTRPRWRRLPSCSRRGCGGLVRRGQGRDRCAGRGGRDHGPTADKDGVSRGPTAPPSCCGRGWRRAWLCRGQERGGGGRSPAADKDTVTGAAAPLWTRMRWQRPLSRRGWRRT